MSWEEFIDQLRPLGAKMAERLPPRLRDDPHTLAEAQRLLLAATMRCGRCHCRRSCASYVRS